MTNDQVTNMFDIGYFKQSLDKVLNDEERKAFELEVHPHLFNVNFNKIAVTERINNYVENKNLGFEKINEVMKIFFLIAIKKLDEFKDDELIPVVCENFLSKFAKNILNKKLFRKDELLDIKKEELIMSLCAMSFYNHTNELINAKKTGASLGKVENFNFIDTLLSIYFQNNLSVDKEKTISLLMERSLDVRKNRGVSLIDIFHIKNEILTELAKICNKYLEEHQQYNFYTYENLVSYTKWDKPNEWVLCLNEEKFGAYFGVNKELFNGRFWSDVAGELFGLGNNYFDSNTTIRSYIDDKFIEFKFTKNMSEEKQQVYMELIKENISRELSEYVKETMGNDMQTLIRAPNSRLKEYFPTKIVESVYRNMREVIVSEQLQIKTDNVKRKKI